MQDNHYMEKISYNPKVMIFAILLEIQCPTYQMQITMETLGNLQICLKGIDID